MKVTCINNIISNDMVLNLTIGKSYQVLKSYHEFSAFTIIDDLNTQCMYHKSWFQPLEEMREETLNKILE